MKSLSTNTIGILSQSEKNTVPRFVFKFFFRSSHRGVAETNLTRNHEVAGSIPGPTQLVKDLALLWLWCRPAAATPIRPLAWELLCAMSAA